MFFNADAGGVSLNFQEDLPGVAKIIAAVTVWGIEQPTATEPRTFILDTGTRATEGRIKSTISERHANIQYLTGAEGTNPQKPAIPSNVLVVAWVTLSTTGVETILPATENRARSLADHNAELGQLEAWKTSVGSAIDTINTMLAVLASRINNLTPLDSFLRLIVDVVRLKEKANLPSSYTTWGSDYFLDDSDSDTQNVDYHCRIEEGIRFPFQDERFAELQLLNPIDDNVKVADGFVLPKYHEARRLANVAPVDISVPYTIPVWTSYLDYRESGQSEIVYKLAWIVVGGSVSVSPTEINISQFANQAFGWTKVWRVRSRWRWGLPYYSSSRVTFWWNLRYDPIYETFRRLSGDTGFVILPGPPFNYPVPAPGVFAWRYAWTRVKWFWHDFVVDHHYWDRYVALGSVNGSVVAQTFLNAQDGWLTGLNLFFTRRGSAGDVTVLLCETTETGQPNKEAVITTSSIAVADIKLWPYPTRVFFSPNLVTQGKRYAIILLTQGAHFCATTERNQLISGTLFYSTDQIWFQGLGDMTKDLCFELIYAEFEANRTVVQLANAGLPDGIAAIDINTDAQVPDGTTLTFEAQLSGIWYPINDPGPDPSGHPLVGLPDAVPIRAVFQGTPALMPGFTIGVASQIYTWQPGPDMTHISAPRTMPVATPVTTVIATYRLEAWRYGGSPAHHTAVITLLHGTGASYGTETSATGVVDTPAPEDPDNVLIRKATFSSVSPASAAFKLKIVGHTDNRLTPFHVAERIDIDLA